TPAARYMGPALATPASALRAPAAHYVRKPESSGFLKAFGRLHSCEFAELGRWQQGLTAAICARYCQVSGGCAAQLAGVLIRSRLPSGSRSSISHPWGGSSWGRPNSATTVSISPTTR